MGTSNKRYNVHRKKRYNEKPVKFIKQSIRHTVVCAVIFLVCLPLSSSDNQLKAYISKALVATSDIDKAKLHFNELCLKADEKYPFLSENILWSSFIGGIKGEQTQESETAEQNKPTAVAMAEEKLELVVKASGDEFVYPENVNMIMPIQGEVTSPFGEREHPVSGQDATHYGVDIAGDRGEVVKTTAPGKVVEVKVHDIYGNCVLIQHTERIKSFYAHLDTVTVSQGDIVHEATQIGTVGSSGVATGPHLHFGVRVDNEPVDPEKYIKMVHRHTGVVSN